MLSSLMTMLNGLVKNPYSDAYQQMDEFELIFLEGGIRTVD
jgi:hypothetical protein